MGWGYGTANYTYIEAQHEANLRVAVDVTYFDIDRDGSSASIPLNPGPDDVAIVFLNSDSGENQYTVHGNHGDRDADGLSAWRNGDQHVKDVAAKYSNVIVVVHTVGPLVVDPGGD